MAIIPFGDWTPDQAPMGAGALEILNVMPTDGGYKPFPTFLNEATAVAARVQGAIAVRDTVTGAISNFCGTATKLYKMASDGLSWTDVSRAVGGAYATASNGRWSFSAFGSTVIATNGVDTPQEYIFGGTGLFTVLGGSPPVASYIATVDPGFVMLARTDGFSTGQWSMLENSGSWTPTVGMADIQLLPDGGIIMGLSGGPFPLIFQERAIRRMQFVGPPVVFDLGKISEGIGAADEGSISAWGDVAFFRASSGMYMIQGGQAIVPIGKGKVSEWITNNINSSKLELVSSAIDPSNSLYLLAFPSSGVSTNISDTLILYHWPTDRWAHCTINLEWIYTAIRQSGYTLDALDSITTNLDALSYSLDNTIWTGTNTVKIGGFDISHRSGFLTGPAGAAELETGEFQPTEGRNTLIRSIKPMIEGTNVTPSMSLKHRNLLTENTTTTADCAMNAYGRCSFRTNGRYFRAKVKVSAGSEWSFAIGIDDLVFSPMGGR